MRKLAGFLFFFGLGSMILNKIGYEFVLLGWIDSWGPDKGWKIRVGMVVSGLVLWGLSLLNSPRSGPAGA